MSDPDIANDTSTGAEIQLESFFDGVLEAHDDVDWIKVVITNAGTYEFTLMVTDGDLNDGYLILYDAEGIQLSLSDNGGGGAADVMQTTLQAGTYFLAAAAQGGVNAGTYHMTAALMQSNTAPTFSPEDTLTGVAEGTNAQYTLLDLLDNASDADNNDTLSIDGEVLVKDGDDSIIGTATLDEDTYTITLDDEDYNGDVFLSYTVTDGTDTVAGSATYNVSAVNDDPTGTAAVVADKVEDTPFSLTRAQLLANISDIEDADEDLTISIGAVTGGTFILNGTSGDYDFTPTTDFSGAASITYTVTDTDGGDIEVTSNFNIIAADLPNDDTTTAQVIVDGAAFTSLLGSNDDVDWVKVVITEAGTYAFDLALTDGGLNDGHMMLFDAGSNFLTYDGDSGPGLDPRIVVTLEPGTYYLDIDNNNAPAATYSLTATSVNDAPTNSGDISLTDTIEGASVTTTVTALLANADDIDAGDTLSIQDGEIAVTDGEGTIIGSASISGDDVTITLTDINYNGDVNLDYIITDGEATVAGSASYNLSPVNDAPTNSGNIALTDTIEGASVTTTVTALLANADDVDGDTLSIQDGEITVTDGDGTIIGSASISGNDVTITLDDINYNGVVNLDYVITDAESNLNGVPPSGDATVAGSASYNLSPVNDAPTVSGPVTLTGVDEGTDAVFTLADLLANASDVDHDVLSIAGSVSVFSGATLMGTASLDDDSYTISLPENFNGSIDLVYTVTDGEESYATSATYTVAAVNDAPTFGDEVTLTGVNEDTPAVFSVEDLLFGAEDVDLDGLSISGNAISVEDAKGNTIGSAVYDDGDFTITLDENYNGTVNLEYAVTDGDETVAGSATYEVASVNDGGPVLTGEPTDLGNPIANDSFAFTADDLLEGYTDVDNDELSISGTVTSNHGTVTDLGGGNYSFEPAEDYIGKVTFSYDVTDGHVTVDGALSTYVISDINDLVTTYNPLTQGAVNTVTAGAQNSSAVAQLSGGGYVVTWTGTDLSGSTASVGVKAQRFNNDGTTNGSEFQVNTTGTNQQYQPTITGLSGGGYVIAWASNVQDGSAYGVYFKQYDAAGTVVLAETRANTHAGSDQHQPVVTAFSDGSYMISWASASINTGDGSSFGIAAQKFNANGTTSGSEFLINVYTTLDQQSPAITALADNSFVVTWHSNGQEGSGNGYGIYAQRYNASGVAQGEVHVNTTNAGNQRFPATAALDDGGYVIAWQDSATTDVHFQRYNASGVAQGTNTTANSGATSGTQTDPAIASLSTGGFVIVWTTSNDGNGSGIYAQRFHADGTTDGSALLVNTTTTGEQVAPSVATLTNGSFVVTWTSADASGTGIFQKIIEANTAPYLEGDQASLRAGTEDTPIQIHASELLFGVADGEANTLDVTSITGDNFTASVAGSMWTITPDENFNGTLTLNYTVSDGSGGTLNLTQELVVEAVNDAPIVTGDLDDTATEGGSSVVIDALDNVSDVEESELTVIAEDSLPAGVTLSGSTFTFDPTNAAYNSLAVGETTDIVIDYEISDGTTTTESSITITVTGTNDAPVFEVCGDDTGSVTEDGSILVSLIGAPVGPAETQTATGDIDFGDVDLTDTHTVDVESNELISGLGNVPVHAYVGTLTASVTPAGKGGGGTVNWTFSVDNDDIQFLAVGQTLTQTYDVTVSDGWASDTETVTITITGTNDAPVLTGVQATLEDGTEDEDYIVSVEDLLAGFSDVDDLDTLSVANLTASNGATVTNNLDGTYTIEHADDFDGMITLTYAVNDGHDGSIEGVTLDYDVVAVNDAPIGNDSGSIMGTEDEDTVIDIADLISDVDNPDGELTITAESADGTITIDGTEITFTPDADFQGTTTITYTVEDEDGETDTGTLTVLIANTNDAPTADDFDGGTTDEEEAIVIDVASHIDDIDPSTTLEVTEAESEQGTITIDGTELTFTPADDFYGTATITYTVSDGVTTTQGEITVEVTNTYDAPSILPDAEPLDMLEDTVINLSVEDFLTGIYNPDDAEVTISDVFASEGTITLNGNGTYRYNPPNDYYGEVTINFTLFDGTTEVLSELKINIENVNDAPDAPTSPGSLGSFNEDTDFDGLDSDLLAGWTDIDFERDEDNTLPDLVVSEISVNHGTVERDGHGGFTITPDANYNGTITVTYKVSDGTTEVTATRSLTVTPVADAPVRDEQPSLPDATEDTDYAILSSALLARITDPDGDAEFTITEILGVSSGSIVADGSNYIYTPDADYSGNVTINYRVSDGESTTDFAANFVVNAVNDAPRGDAATLTGVLEDTTAAFTKAQLLEDIYDIDGGATNNAIMGTNPNNDLTVTAISATHGTFVYNAEDDTYDFLADANYSGEASITYSVSDGIDSEEFTSTFTVGAVNDDPTGTGGTITGATEDVELAISRATLLADVTDIDDTDTSAWTIDNLSATNGTFASDGEGGFTFTSTAEYFGEATITYRVSDGSGGSVELTSTFTVARVMDEVSSSTSATLGTNKDKLILTGSDDIDGTGNSLDNILVGNAGMNRLNGGTGADTMFGGGEDDLYIVDNVGDVASEQTVEGIDDGGFDTVRSSVSYTLGAYIENLRLTGSGNINATGNSSANYLFGNAGNNALDGSFGGDIMDGGLGNDTYYVNVGTDEVIEYAAGGTDTVVSQVSYTLGDNLENISLASWGTAATNAWGNAVANVVTGGRGSNQLYGLDGADTIVGGEGNDTIDGGNGADSMSGGLGSDVYYVNDASDVVFEDAGTGTGTDTVISTVNWTLGSNVEKLTLGGTDNVYGGGNTMNNTITGNAGNNGLDGGSGADTISGGAGTDGISGGTGNDNLTGGADADTFYFAKTGGGTDRIMDFQSGIDLIAFSEGDFTNTLANTTFTSNANGTAVGTGGQFVYNTTTHTLVWDSNGTGSGGVTATIIFDTAITITKSDLVFYTPI